MSESHPNGFTRLGATGRGAQALAEIIANDAAWPWIAQPGFQVSTRGNVTGINWYASEDVDWSKGAYTA